MPRERDITPSSAEAKDTGEDEAVLNELVEALPKSPRRQASFMNGLFRVEIYDLPKNSVLQKIHKLVELFAGNKIEVEESTHKLQKTSGIIINFKTELDLEKISAVCARHKINLII